MRPDRRPERRRRAPHEVRLVERHARRAASQRERPGPRHAQERVVQRHRLKDRAELVVAIRPVAEHPQIEVDLRIGPRAHAHALDGGGVLAAKRARLSKLLERHRRRVRRNVDLEHSAVERLVDVDLRQPNRQVGHARPVHVGSVRRRIVAGPARREVGVSHVDRSRAPRRPSATRRPPAAASSSCRPASTATQRAIERAPACHGSAREAAPGNNRPQVLGTDRHAGERLERRRRGRVAEHTALPRQHERRVFANGDVGEDGLARRRKLEAHPRGRFEARVDLRAEALVPGAAGDRQDARPSCGRRGTCSVACS